LKFDEFVLSKEPPLKRTRPNIIVCEGYSDACFVSALLANRQIGDYDVGCPTQAIGGAQGKDRIPVYLNAIAANPSGLRGVLIAVDADSDPNRAFQVMARALGNTFGVAPNAPYVVAGGALRAAVYLFPAPGSKGCLEHLIWHAAAGNRRLRWSVESFAIFTGRERKWKLNQRAKMRVNSAIAAHCEDDPACSLSRIWREKGNPVPINSPDFSPLAQFLQDFQK
jgi:hypothetical protein